MSRTSRASSEVAESEGNLNDLFIVPSLLRPVRFGCLDISPSSSSGFSLPPQAWDPGVAGVSEYVGLYLDWTMECVLRVQFDYLYVFWIARLRLRW